MNFGSISAFDKTLSILFVSSEDGVTYEHPSKYWFKGGEGGMSPTAESEAKRHMAWMESEMNVSRVLDSYS